MFHQVVLVNESSDNRDTESTTLHLMYLVDNRFPNSVFSIRVVWLILNKVWGSHVVLQFFTLCRQHYRHHTKKDPTDRMESDDQAIQVIDVSINRCCWSLALPFFHCGLCCPYQSRKQCSTHTCSFQLTQFTWQYCTCETTILSDMIKPFVVLEHRLARMITSDDSKFPSVFALYA